MTTREEPTRYTFVKDDELHELYEMDCKCHMANVSSGEYVTAAAYDALARERDALRGVVEHVRRASDADMAIQKAYDGHDAQAAFKADEVYGEVYNNAICDAIDAVRALDAGRAG